MAFLRPANETVVAWSLMRCVFAFEICLIHVCTPIWLYPEPGSMAGTIFISVTRTGTVGFMMLAGAILIARTTADPATYLSARLRRWLPTLAIAQVLYLMAGIWYAPAPSSPMESFTWTDVFRPAWYHLWFFYALAVIYVMVLPMRRYAAWAGTLPRRGRLLALWLPVGLMLAGLGWSTLMRGGFWGDLRPENLLIYCGYAWTGYVLAETFPRGAPSGWWMLVAGVAAAALATTLASDAAGEPVRAYFHRCTLFIAVAAIGQFVLLLRANTAQWRPATVLRVNNLSRLTLGIFIVHPLVIAVARWPHDWAKVGSVEWVSLPVAAVVLFVLSGLFTWLSLRMAGLLRAARGGLAAGTQGA